MGAENVRIQADAGNPLRNKPSIFFGREPAFSASPSTEQKFTRLLRASSQVFIDGLSGLLGQFEPDGLAGFPLADRRDRLRSRLVPRPRLASAQLAVDPQVEHCEIARSSFGLQLTPDGPNVLWPEGRFDACKLSFIPRRVPPANGRRAGYRGRPSILLPFCRFRPLPKRLAPAR
jgi:hypothetical protein